MKRKTTFQVKIIFNDGIDSQSCIKTCKSFNTVKRLRKFIQAYKETDLLYCWRDTVLSIYHRRKPVRCDDYYVLDCTDRLGWIRLSKKF
jgi:hypothetical protein